MDLSAQNQPEAFAPVIDDPALPRVLLIGDSISIGYTVAVRTALAGKANVHRNPGNAGTSANGVFMMETWLPEKDKWQLIHFNFGLHDLKQMSDEKQQVDISDYERYLRLFITRLQKTGAKLIFATTTPVPEGKVNPPRSPDDVVLYNNIAKRVMKDEEIPVDDLYELASKHLDWQLPLNVHYKPEGYQKLGEEVARVIGANLRQVTVRSGPGPI